MYISLNMQKKHVREAAQIFGLYMIKKLLFFILYMLGIEAKVLSKKLDISVDTFNQLMRRIKNQGLPALVDRRRKTASFLPSPINTNSNTNTPFQPQPQSQLQLDSYSDDRYIYLRYDPSNIIRLAKNNPVQTKTVLLTLLD